MSGNPEPASDEQRVWQRGDFVHVEFDARVVEPPRDDYFGTMVVANERADILLITVLSEAVSPQTKPDAPEDFGSIDPEIAAMVPGAVDVMEQWRRDRAARLQDDGDELVRMTGVLIAAALAWTGGRDV